jgi:hypothetical protein
VDGGRATPRQDENPWNLGDRGSLNTSTVRYKGERSRAERAAPVGARHDPSTAATPPSKNESR